MKSSSEIMKMANDDNNVIAALMYLRDEGGSKAISNAAILMLAELFSEAETTGDYVTLDWNRTTKSLNIVVARVGADASR